MMLPFIKMFCDNSMNTAHWKKDGIIAIKVDNIILIIEEAFDRSMVRTSDGENWIVEGTVGHHMDRINRLLAPIFIKKPEVTEI